MAGFRYRAGAGSVTIGPELEQALDRIAGGAFRAAREGLAAKLDPIAQRAESEWYTQVKRRTGKSGQWASVVEVSDTQVRGYVESLDTRKDKKGRPAWVFVRRPKAISVVELKVDDAEYAEVMAEYRATGKLPPNYEGWKRADGLISNLQRIARNPLADDGGSPAQDLVVRPTRAAAKELVKTIGPAIAKLGGR